VTFRLSKFFELLYLTRHKAGLVSSTYTVSAVVNLSLDIACTSANIMKTLSHAFLKCFELYKNIKYRTI